MLRMVPDLEDHILFFINSCQDENSNLFQVGGSMTFTPTLLHDD
jgi:hypothetical protein